MAAHLAEIKVSELSEAGEIRPNDDQAIVFEIQKDIPNEEYIFKLDEYIKDDSS